MIIIKFIIELHGLKWLYISGVRVGVMVGIHENIFIYLHFKELFLINFNYFIFRIRIYFAFPPLNAKDFIWMSHEFYYFKTYFFIKNLFNLSYLVIPFLFLNPEFHTLIIKSKFIMSMKVVKVRLLALSTECLYFT